MTWGLELSSFCLLLKLFMGVICVIQSSNPSKHGSCQIPNSIVISFSRNYLVALAQWGDDLSCLEIVQGMSPTQNNEWTCSSNTVNDQCSHLRTICRWFSQEVYFVPSNDSTPNIPIWYLSRPCHFGISPLWASNISPFSL